MIPTSRAAIIATQDTYLRALLIAIDGRNPFYTAKMRAAGLRGADCDRATFLAKFPFTTKAELVADHAAHAPFGSNLTFPVERYVRYSQTSGSTGLPLRWLDTAESWTWMLDYIEQNLLGGFREILFHHDARGRKIAEPANRIGMPLRGGHLAKFVRAGRILLHTDAADAGLRELILLLGIRGQRIGRRGFRRRRGLVLRAHHARCRGCEGGEQGRWEERVKFHGSSCGFVWEKNECVSR